MFSIPAWGGRTFDLILAINHDKDAPIFYWTIWVDFNKKLEKFSQI